MHSLLLISYTLYIVLLQSIRPSQPDYMLRIDCWEAEKNLTTTPGSECALNALAIDEPLEYAKLYLDGTMQMWVDTEDSLEI